MGKTQTFSKSDLVAAVSAKTDTAKTNVLNILDATLSAIRAQADAGTTVAIAGFGRFEVKTKPARTGRNPRTGETVQIPESRKLTFRPSKSKP
ncbi:HU family DNA-binding protein [Rhodobacter maris]|uniref:Viral histone-like protein n=1 Tax=Rhodobacter maris TaxID=446682 RepID=A0A285TC67_9RHOB|nr:HU family DNA-binding protein [Rhodobacter maris]SOC19591.1 DNA-binding protein HU-beta [Rhodobacter maris]